MIVVVRVAQRARRKAALLRRVVVDALDRHDHAQLRNRERVRRVVGIDHRQRLAIELEGAADEAACLGEERIAQAALPVEVVDRHVHERVRRQRPHRGALPHAVLADEVGDPVLVRREIRPDGRHGLERQIDAAGAAGTGTRVRRRAVREEADVDADEHGDNEHACSDSQGFARASSHRLGIYRFSTSNGVL